MSRQHEVTTGQRLLDSDGRIAEPGWARQQIWEYNRECIRAPRIRRKEWDYYLITGGRYAVAFTISDLGYVGLISVSFIDLQSRAEHTESIIDLMPLGKKYGLGCDAAHVYGEAYSKKFHLCFSSEGSARRIRCRIRNFLPGKDFAADFLIEETMKESMCIATPWSEKPTAFYYNEKKNCMTARGRVRIGDDTYIFAPGENFAVLDWGRGVWTYDNTWYWGTGSGLLDGKSFGFNLGYGFSDRSSASENVIFYDGKVHKLDEVTFEIPKDTSGADIFTGEKWRLTSNDGRLEGTFEPILDRASDINLKIIRSDQHQTFGYFTGIVVLDDGQILKPKCFLCAIEKVRNRY